MPDLAIIVPTRGRPENIRKVISAWDFTNAWDHADLVLVADADDPEIGGYHEVIRDTMHPDTSEPLLRLMHVDEWEPMVHKLNRAARDLAEEGRYFALGFAGDDHLPQTIGWAARYLTVLRELGTGMVYSDDGYQGRKLSTEWAVTSDAVRALGRMVPADVEHMYCDNAMMDLFGGAGAMRHLPEIRIEHMHPYAKKAPSDAQYERVNGREQYAKDRRAYEGWRGSVLMSDQLDKIRNLRKGRPNVSTEPTPTPRASRVLGSGPRRVERRAPQRSGPSAVRRQDQQTLDVPRPPRHFKNVRAATPEDIMIALADFATQVAAHHEIVELGVFQGRTALQLAWGASMGHGAHVTAIDPWDLLGNTYGPPFTDAESRTWAHHWVDTLGYADKITLVQGFSHEVAEVWDGDSEHCKRVGLLFVDGDHTKEGAKRDIVSWAPHLAPSARIAVDDYGHPDWPGVGEAVDELVAEGFLNPIEIFHDRLAVTTLAVTPGCVCDVCKLGDVGDCDHEIPGKEPVTAITSEGVSPSPVAPVSTEPGCLHMDCVLDHPHAGPAVLEPEPPHAPPVPSTEPELTPTPETLEAEWERVDPEGVAALRESGAALRERERVRGDELPGVAAGTPIEELNTVQLRALARAREIVLGARKDKRAEMLQALRDGS